MLEIITKKISNKIIVALFILMSLSSITVVYFTTTTPQQQQNLIQAYPSRSLLSLSINNPACEIGSIFCLYNKKTSSTFKINLDALSYSKVHIDPRVLILAKNTE